MRNTTQRTECADEIPNDETGATAGGSVYGIDRLTLAIEYLGCTIRALAWGHPVGSRNVSEPAQWASALLAEFLAPALPGQDGDDTPTLVEG